MKLEEIIPRFERYLKQFAGGAAFGPAYTKKLEEIKSRFERYIKESPGGADFCSIYTDEPIAKAYNLVAKNKKEIELGFLTEAEAIVYIHRGLKDLRKKASGGAEKRIYTEVEERFQIYRDTYFLDNFYKEKEDGV